LTVILHDYFFIITLIPVHIFCYRVIFLAQRNWFVAFARIDDDDDDQNSRDINNRVIEIIARSKWQIYSHVHPLARFIFKYQRAFDK